MDGTNVMFFLLRVAFWLTLALALLPSGGSSNSSASKGPQVGAADAVSAATAAVSDVTSFCDRQAEACAVGAQAATAIGQRAQAGAKMVYEFINDRMSQGETGSVPTRANGKIVPASLPSQDGSQNTLHPADLAPDWRGPAPRRDAQPQRRDPRHPA